MREKVLFVQKYDDGSFEIEGLWCIKKEQYYIVDNIPLIASRISFGDTISVEYDKQEKEYYFFDFIQVSGNTTVRLLFNNNEDIESTSQYLRDLECNFILESNLMAVNIPPFVDYYIIKKVLEKGEKDGRWSYQESCLMHPYK